MEKATFYFGFIFILIFFSCKKENISINQVSQKSFSDSSVQYLKTQLPSEDFEKLDVQNKKVLRYHGKNIGVQIFEKNQSSGKYLLVKKDGNSYSGNWIDMSNLKLSNDSLANGTVRLQNINRETQVNLTVKNNEVTQAIKTSNNFSHYQIINYKHLDKRLCSYSREEKEEVELPEIIIYRSPDVDFISLYWLFDEASEFEDMYYGGGGGGETNFGGGGGNSSDNVTSAPTFTPPTKPIADIKTEVKCFSNNASSTYSISVNINEPSPGTRNVFEPFASFLVGHTFLTLEQHNADGSSIVRNIGFYPKNSVKPGDPLDAAIFGDDSNTPFDVSLKIQVSGSDFNTVIHNLANQTLVYDLNNFNCTNSAMDALKSININLPSTKSNGALFSGNDPGDLGEDIRNMDLNNFSAANGGRQITRTLSNSNNQTAPLRNGDC
jgi:hypothetical protein